MKHLVFVTTFRVTLMKNYSYENCIELFRNNLRQIAGFVRSKIYYIHTIEKLKRQIRKSDDNFVKEKSAEMITIDRK